MDPPEKWRRIITANPYADRSVELVASTVLADAWTGPVPWGTPDLAKFVDRGRTLLRTLQGVVQFWTPQRSDDEALRRAANINGQSIVAQEAAIFTAVYHEWVDSLLGWAPRLNADGEIRAAGELVWRALADALARLERIASSIEARATDLHLQYGFERVSALLAGREMATAIIEAIRTASENTESSEHFEKVARDLQQEVGRLKSLFGEAHGEITYVADVVARRLDAESYKTKPQIVVRKLGEVVTLVTLKEFLRVIAAKIIEP